MTQAMDVRLLLPKIAWNMQAPWHLRQPPPGLTLSVPETVRGLQRALLAEHGALLQQTLQHACGHPVPLMTLAHLDIVLYQEGRDQRVWRAQARLMDGTACSFGIIVARAPGASHAVTQRDGVHLHTLHQQYPEGCVTPYVTGTAPVAGGLAFYTVEWLDDYKELVFEITLDGGVFLVNAHGAQRRFSPQESRQIWRRMVEIFWWYPQLRGVNIQAGDFVVQVQDDGQMAVKLTTARELVSADWTPAHLHALLGSLITASGYLSDGQRPFARQMPQAAFMARMLAVLQRRFGARAPMMAEKHWAFLQAGMLAQQEDWLKEDCMLGTYARFRVEAPATRAWKETCARWLAYAAAVQAGQLPASWWFPATEIAPLLDQLCTDVLSPLTAKVKHDAV